MPALALLVALLSRRYPGERALLALRDRRRPVRWPHPSSHLRSSRRVVLAVIRGGQLIARSLAVRPPPAAAVSS
jgi:hypothetical protein